MYCPFVRHQDHPYGPTGSGPNVAAFRNLEAVAKLAQEPETQNLSLNLD